MDEPLRARFAQQRERARSFARAEGPDIFASDASPRSVEAARANASRIGATVQFGVARIGALEATRPSGTVVANLPYGERIAIEPTLWDELGDAMRRCTKMRWALLLGGAPPDGALPPPDALIPLWNGPIECRLATLDPR